VKIVTFITDFGTQDAFVGSMKGAFLSITDQVHMIDITHDVPSQDILSAQLILNDAYPYFPEGTIHVAVVDPGVGTQRKPLIVESKGHIFVGPDNGLFSFTLEDPEAKFWMIDADRISPSRSATFEGRDLFAIAAGRLCKKERISSIGRSISTIVDQSPPKPVWNGKVLEGEVLQIDRFGNLMTNIQWAQVEKNVTVHLGKRKIGRAVRTYGDGKPTKPLALWNSTGKLEIAIPNGSAAMKLRAKRGTKVTVTKG
jgi:S-adenosyl-L-methionine hydrolase (adenosine-forming)